MSKVLFAGLSGVELIPENLGEDSSSILCYDRFVPIPGEGVTDIEIGWDYFLVWKNNELYMSGKATSTFEKSDRLLQIPGHENIKFKQAIPSSEKVTVLTDGHEIWVHNIYEGSWKQAANFIGSRSEEAEEKEERVVKIAQGRCTVALTDSGQAFNIPISLNDPSAIRFADVACGFDHSILLTHNGDVYSIGMGTRGQLGHGDLEDCDEPKLIEALAGLKVTGISAFGWHSTAVTVQGDLYTWGWNNNGQLGQPDVKNVMAEPKPVDFKNEAGELVEINIDKAQCGSGFTICRTDTGEFWGCGSNKYGQLALPRKEFSSLQEFVKLRINDVDKPIKDFKCREWGTCIYI